MGNINNIWYLKDSGGDWASTKCALDDCYSIPFIPQEDDSLFLQADIPDGYSADEVWLTDLAGNHLQELLPMTDWKYITGAGMNRLIFRVPQDSYACVGIHEEVMECIADLMWAGLPGADLVLLNNYVNGLYNTHILLGIGGTWYDIDSVLPPGFEKVGPTQIKIPCDTPYESLTWRLISDVGGAANAWPYNMAPWIVSMNVINIPLDCFRFHIPLKDKDGQAVTELVSEPFHCPKCEETVKISSDYCLSRTDIFGQFIFNTAGFGNNQYGSLTEAKNDLRIQAVLKKLPSELKQNRNQRCNNFKSKITKRYKLQGAMTDFPDYMMNIIESIFAGKKIYINGAEYIADDETIFKERNVAGRSMKQLDVTLSKCVQGTVFQCGNCHMPSCDDNPLEYHGIVFATPAPSQGYGVDRSVWRFSIDTNAILGGLAPYEIFDWQAYICQGTITPHNGIEPWDDSRDFNFYQRGISFNGDCYVHDDNQDGDLNDPGDIVKQEGCSCLSVLVKIRDARGCVKQLGNTVDIDDLRCVGQDGELEIDDITNSGVTVTNVAPIAPGVTFSISLNNGGPIATGLTGADLPYVITGLNANTEYSIRISVECGVLTSGYIGPLFFETLP